MLVAYLYHSLGPRTERHQIRTLFLVTGVNIVPYGVYNFHAMYWRYVFRSHNRMFVAIFGGPFVV